MLTKKDILGLEIRRSIYDFIDKNPGLNLRSISKRLNIPMTTLKYHLKLLKKFKLIKENKEGEYKRIYIIADMGAPDKQILVLLRQKIPCRIFLYCLFHTAFSQIELSKELNLHPSTISYHLKKLLDMGIIEEVPVHNGRIYAWKKIRHSEFTDYYIDRKPIGTEKLYIRKNQETIDAIYRLLITNKHSLPDKEIINFFIIVQEFRVSWWNSKIKTGVKLPKKIQNVEDRTNSLIDLCYEIFRPPFCA